METSQIKRFAIEARTVLRQGVINKIATLGFNAQGEVRPDLAPVLAQGATVFGGRIIDGDVFYHQWNALSQAVARKGLREVYEEVAYTWFNRFIAIRILQKNGLITPVLAYGDDGRTPVIIQNAQLGMFPEGMSDRAKRRVNSMLGDPSKVSDLFAVLVTAFCHATPLIDKIFGRMDDYTELLLPDNILAPGGFLELLNNTPYLTDEDYKHTELIGWLYQFYISDRKDEVFASFDKGKKANAEDIPAATQIFTPNWIVKYMVENTLGRIYLDNHPEASFKSEMKYLVEPAEQEGEKPIYKFEKLEDLKCADLSCGSGHILTEFFDLLYKCYNEEWYEPRTAIESILQNNLTGVDLDTRAKQLSMFALMLKACQIDNSFKDGKVLPKVYDMPKPWTELGLGSDLDDYLPHFFLGASKKVVEETKEALELMKQADNLGSIMKFNLSEATRTAIETAVSRWRENEESIHKAILPSFDLMLALTDKYSAIAMNPPYMGSGNMNAKLSSYVKQFYEEGKEDLCTVFMILSERDLLKNGLYSMINMQSWMFNSRLTSMRNHVLNELSIESMLHLGARTFDELSGEIVQNSSFVVRNSTPSEYTNGTYYRLVNGKDCSSKEILFLNYEKYNVRYRKILQRNLIAIPGNPICYWASKQVVELFNNSYLGQYGWGSKGIITGENSRFLRLWHEVGNQSLKLDAESLSDSIRSSKKWFPCTKGGSFRKWFGNNDYIIDWEGNGYRVIRCAKEENRNCQDYQDEYKFSPSFSWADVCSNNPSFRYTTNSLSESKGMCLFSIGGNLYEMGGFLNSCVANYLLLTLSPTLMVTAGAISKLPFLGGNQIIRDIVKQNILISKFDWDAHETSWDFQQSPLLEIQKEMIEHATISSTPNSLKSLVDKFCKEWEEKFFQLHANEEELNRQFIEIYGLQDELTPDVPLDEITILQQKEISIENDQIVWHKDVLIKQFISYAVGCMVGRYRLDKTGLNIAHSDATEAELASYEVNGHTFEIDDDGILPLMPEHSCFSDNAVSRMKELLVVTMGEKNLTSNINYIQECLGESLEDYFRKDFWKEHKQRYSNRPIYWLFSSKKGAFQVIAYMHRMNEFTCNQVRNYLLKHIEDIRHQVESMEHQESSLSATERRQLDKLRKDLSECMEYDDRLHDVALKQIKFDLDDGVVVNYAKFGDVLQKLK